MDSEIVDEIILRANPKLENIRKKFEVPEEEMDYDEYQRKLKLYKERARLYRNTNEEDMKAIFGALLFSSICKSDKEDIGNLFSSGPTGDQFAKLLCPGKDLRYSCLLLAMFYNIFYTVPELPGGDTDNLYFVLDGGSLIHRVVWPKQETFGDVYTTYVLSQEVLRR
ncbi:hypothetical protein AVEN_93503-1 [Araneus ventricosus]|uniref:Uncharacterized protein n=1 Tax=Araneus ventricosus TaxID=182803 RepID=A0A4Y2APQ6_ARAVE|nr:hypothetical protein AVEN_93503-1 [Araneus ventricosus]